jgi:elongation factor P
MSSRAKTGGFIMKASGLKRGMVINEEGGLYMVIEIAHHTPNYRAVYQTTLKNITTQRVIKKSYDPIDQVEEVILESHKVQYLYKDDSGYHFMNMETYEEFTLSVEIVGDAKNYMKENGEVAVLYIENTPVSIELPPRVDLKVIEAPMAIRGDTVGTARKLITLETGYKINAPLFIAEGDVVRIDTVTGEYTGRA